MTSAPIQLLAATFVAIASFVAGPRTVVVQPPPDSLPSISQAAAQTGIITAIFSSLVFPPAPAPAPGTSATTTLATSTATTTAVAAKKFASSTSTTSTTLATSTGLLPIVVIKIAPTSTPSSTQATTAIITPKKKIVPAPVVAATTLKTAAPAPLTMTAAQILANATTSLEQRLGGNYALVFKIISGGKTALTWTYGDTQVGGAASDSAQFSADYNCDVPPIANIGESPLFTVRTTYNCTVALTPLSGTDRRIQSGQFTFATGPGTLSVMTPSSMSTHLVSDENDGGFTFANQDTQPITVTSETFDISFAGLSTSYGPLVLRLVDPKDPTNHLDYHLENTPVNPAVPFTYNVPGITLSFPFTINGSAQKLLPVQILGVHKLSVEGTDPTVKVTLRGFTTDRTDIKRAPGTPQILWSCVVTLAAYDPNATSGPFATGDACLN